MSEQVDTRALRALMEGATPISAAVKLERYAHGGGRLHQDAPAGERVLIADFYEEGDRELFYALRIAAPALLDEVDALRARVAELEREVDARRRLCANDYRDWSIAGGRADDQCKHGVDTTRFDCRRCDEDLVEAAIAPRAEVKPTCPACGKRVSPEQYREGSLCIVCEMNDEDVRSEDAHRG